MTHTNMVSPSSTILHEISSRLDFGKEKYGTGLKHESDISVFTDSKEDSFIYMGLEELYDAVVYNIMAKIRYLHDKGKYQRLAGEMDDNEFILLEISRLLKPTASSMYSDSMTKKYDIISLKILDIVCSFYDLMSSL